MKRFVWHGVILTVILFSSTGCRDSGGGAGPVPVNEAEYCSDVWSLVNTERANMSLNSLTRDAELDSIADGHSEVMQGQGYIFHEGGPDGTFQDRLVGVNKFTYGENVASGYPTPSSVMNGWMDSPDHKDNILDTQFTHLGVGLAMPGYYCTQVFIGR